MFDRAIAGDASAFERLEVAFVSPGGEIARATGTVVHLAADYLAISFEGAEAERLTSAAFPEAEGPSKAGGRPEAREANEERVSADVPLWKRYETMGKAEKIKLARHGNADARRLILRDRDQSLHQFILTNPGLSAREVASMVRAGAVNPTMLQRITSRDVWMNNPLVIEALVKNPFTPIKLAVSLVPRLRKETVKRIAKSGNLRGPILAAARKVVIRK